MRPRAKANASFTIKLEEALSDPQCVPGTSHVISTARVDLIETVAERLAQTSVFVAHSGDELTEVVRALHAAAEAMKYVLCADRERRIREVWLDTFPALREYLENYKDEITASAQAATCVEPDGLGSVFDRLVTAIGGEGVIADLDKAEAARQAAIRESYHRQPGESRQTYLRRIGASMSIGPAEDGGGFVVTEVGKPDIKAGSMNEAIDAATRDLD